VTEELTGGLHLVLLLAVALAADVVEGEQQVVLLVELNGQLDLDLKSPTDADLTDLTDLTVLGPRNFHGRVRANMRGLFL